MEPLLDSPAAAELLGITERGLRKFVVDRTIPFVRVGRLIRFDPAELRAWIDENRSEVVG